MEIRDFFQPLYEQKPRAMAFQGWLHGSGDMVTGPWNKTHGDMIRDNWKEMGIPYEIAKDAEDDYAAPAQLAAYKKGWVRFYTSQYRAQNRGAQLYISATKELYQKMMGNLLKFIREVGPELVILDMIDPLGYPEYVHGKQFVAGDTKGLRDWMQNPVTSVEDSRW